jgi:hypothetical protein
MSLVTPLASELHKKMRKTVLAIRNQTTALRMATPSKMRTALTPEKRLQIIIEAAR